MTKRKLDKKSAYEEAVEWYFKIAYIKRQIESLEKVQGIPLLSISVFLLKTQMIEFELKQLITTLDLHIRFSSTSKVLKMVILKPEDLDRESLGDLVKTIRNRYRSPFIYVLIGKLNKLTTLRNNFAHYLVENEKTIDEMYNSAIEGIGLAAEINKDLSSIRKMLNDNDPLEI